jgi:hypothetical protein
VKLRHQGVVGADRCGDGRMESTGIVGHSGTLPGRA